MLVEPPGPWQPDGLPPGTTAYHYTPPAGLLGILEDRTLWATEANGLNDTSEVVQGRKLIAAYARSELDRDPDDAVMAMLAMAADPELRDPLTGRVYVISASLDPDDAGQWRLYGGARAGYALHIDTDRPLVVVDEPPSHQAQTPSPGPLSGVASVTRWTPVVYSEQGHREIIESLATWVRAEMPDYRAMAEQHFSDDPVKNELVQRALGETGMRLLIESVDAAAALLKPAGFRGEREVRAIIRLHETNEHVRLRANDHGIVQYVRVASPPAGSLPLPSLPHELHPTGSTAATRALPVTGLTVRPTPYFAHGLPALLAALRRADLPGVTPKESEAPLRW